MTPRIIGKIYSLRVDSQYAAKADFLFGYDDGRRVGETWWRGRFKRALRSAGIAPGDRWLTPHSFRHANNTIVRDAGHDPAKIRAELGWMDEEIQDNYTHREVSVCESKSSFSWSPPSFPGWMRR